jgi:hypothetical protein
MSSRNPPWHRFHVDGETFHWRTYSSQQQSDEEPPERCENLDVARLPDAQGVGTSFPAGTLVGEEQAVALVRLFKERGRAIP